VAAAINEIRSIPIYNLGQSCMFPSNFAGDLRWKQFGLSF